MPLEIYKFLEDTRRQLMSDNLTGYILIKWKK